MILPVLAALLAAGQLEFKRPPPPQPGPAEAQPAANLSDDEIRDRIETYLGTIDTPISIERWRALGPRAAPFIEAIVASRKNLPTRRAQAIDGLSAVGGATAPALLTGLSRGEDEPLVVRLSAVRGLGRMVKGAKLAAALKPVLEGAKDARVRGLAAQTLAEHAQKQSCGAVKAQALREDDEAREHYQRALARCGVAPDGAAAAPTQTPAPTDGATPPADGAR
jgi:HEAT repeat protein